MSFDLKVTINTSLAQGTLGYLKKMVGEFGSITATKFTGMFAAAAVAKMAFDKVTQSMEKNMQMAKQISGLSSKFHIDPKQVHSLLMAANDAGVSVRSLLMGMKQLGNLAGRALVDKNSMGVFKQLGMDVEKVGDIAEKPVAQFAEIAKKLMEIDNETDRAAYGTKMLGRQYQQMMPLIEKLGTSAEARANFMDNEAAMTKDQVEQQKMVARMQSEMTDSWDNMIAALAPIILSLTAMVNLLMASAKWMGKIVELKKLFGGLSAFDAKQEVERNREEMRKYEIRKKEAMEAKARLLEADVRLKEQNRDGGISNISVATLAQESNATTFAKAIPGAEWHKNRLDAVRYTGMQADFRTLQGFESEYAASGTQFAAGGGVTEGLYTHGQGGQHTVAKPASMVQSEKLAAEVVKLEQAYKESLAARIQSAGAGMGASGLISGNVMLGGAQGLMGAGLYALGGMAGASSAEDTIELKKKELKELKEKGSLDELAYQAQLKATEAAEDERRAKVKYMETFLKVAGMSMTHYIDNMGNILQGQKPKEGMLRPVEDVDAVKKEDARKKNKRALERKVAREMTDYGSEVAAAKHELGLSTKEQEEHIEEDYKPKEKTMMDAKKLLEAATSERAKYLEEYGTPISDGKGGYEKDAAGNVIKGIDKNKTRYDATTGRTIQLSDEYAGIAKGYESAKSGFETAEKDFDKEESKRVDLANAVYKAERALWQKLQQEKLDAIADEEQAELTLHNRKTQMMELEGKDRREILEENFKFEVAKLEDALAEQTKMQEEFLADGNITVDEQKELDRMDEKVKAQAGKAEGSMFALAKANQPWQIASDMRAIGGGGKVIGTTGNVAIEQLEIIKENLPASTGYLEEISKLLGGGQNKSGDVVTRTSGATYAPVKGSTNSKPGK